MQIIKKYWLGLVGVLLILMAAVMIYQKLHPKKLAPNLVEGTGRMDGDLTNLNTKYPGRLEKIFVEDGMALKKGMVVAVLKSEEQEAQKAQIEGQIEAKKKALKAKKIEGEIAHKTIPLALEKSKAQLDAAKAGVQALQENIALQKNLLSQAKRDYERSKYLFKSKSIDPHTFELSKLNVATEENRYEALQAQVSKARSAVRMAESGVEEAKASQEQLRSIEAGIESFEASIKALEASKKQIEATIAEMTLHSPIDGYTVEKIANEGEVIGAGMPVAMLIDPRSLYLKIFVDTLQNGKIKVGDKAVIFLDAYPNRPIVAKVVRIAQKAEFTPKEVSVRSDRIQRVFAVHLKPLKPDPLLKLGIPAIGVISLDGKGLPISLNEIPVL